MTPWERPWAYSASCGWTGDYVIVHAGFAIERLPEEQALEDLETWEELDDALR